jgi:hypothetical protein
LDSGYITDIIKMASKRHQGGFHVPIHLDLLVLRSCRAGSISGVQSLDSLTISLATGLAVLGLDQRAATSSASSSFGVQVVDEKFTRFAVAIGCVAGNLDNVEDGGCLAEDLVHFFKGAKTGFCRRCT